MSWDGERYQERFDTLAASGTDVHGEAEFVRRFGPGSVLDAGCGTGRVAAELARRGSDVVGVDADPSMIATARRHRPDLTWIESDLGSLDLERTFDVVVMAGNVPLFTPPGTQRSLVSGCARHLAARGLLVTGFQLGRGYGIDDYDTDCEIAGLARLERWATWDRDRFQAGSDYCVSVHWRSATQSRPASG